MEKTLIKSIQINAYLNIIFPLYVSYAMFEHNMQNEYTDNPEDVYVLSFFYFFMFFTISSFFSWLVCIFLKHKIKNEQSNFYDSFIAVTSLILTFMSTILLIKVLNL